MRGMLLVTGLAVAAMAAATMGAAWMGAGSGLDEASQAMDSPSPGAPEAATVAEVPFLVRDCDYGEMILRVPAQLVRPVVPADFALPGALSQVVMGAADCAEGDVGGVQGPVSFFWTDVIVVPLDERLRVEGVSTYLYRIENLVRDDPYRWGNEQVGASYILMDEVDVTLGPTHVSVLAQGSGLRHVAAAPGGALTSPADLVLPFREYGPAPGGYAYLHGELTSGAATGQVPGPQLVSVGSEAMAALGPVQAGLLYFGEGFTFGDARLGYVAMD